MKMPFDVNDQFKTSEHSWIGDGVVGDYNILGSTFEIIEPTLPLSDDLKTVQFDLKDGQDVWAMGVNTRFRIRGQFQFRTKAQVNPNVPDIPAGPWTSCGAAEIADVIVMPNFLDALIEKPDAFHTSTHIQSSDESRNFSSFINAWKYAYMDKQQKKLLCPQEVCPGNGVPTIRGPLGWTHAANSEWNKYAAKIFVTNKTLNFDYRPLDHPIFVQGANYLDEQPKVLPMPNLESIILRWKMHEYPNSIFAVRATVQKDFRFVFKKIQFVAEKLQLSKKCKQAVLETKLWNYPGVCRLMRPVNIPDAAAGFKTTIKKVFYPEGVVIFALPKDVTNGLYVYQENGETGQLFSDHNIAKVSFAFGGQKLFIYEPNMQMSNDTLMESKLMYDYIYNPPFGMRMEPDLINNVLYNEGAKDTPYPHVYFNFCNFREKSRVIPFNNDGSVIKSPKDLDLEFTFKREGSTPNVIYVVYLFYTDVNLRLTFTKTSARFDSDYIQVA